MSKERKPPTYKEQYMKKRKYYEKQLSDMEKRGYKFFDKKTGKYTSPKELLPDIPQRIRKPSINKIEKIYNERYNKLEFISPTTAEIKSGRGGRQYEREQATRKGQATRKKNKIDKARIDRNKKKYDEYQKDKQQKEQDRISKEAVETPKGNYDDIIDAYEDLDKAEPEYDEKDIPEDEEIEWYKEEEDEDDYGTYTDSREGEDTFDEDEWRKEHNEEYDETEEGITPEEVDNILENALSDLENWVAPYWFTPAMQETQYGRIANAQQMILQALGNLTPEELAKRLEDHASDLQDAIDTLLRSYEDENNQEALDTIFSIFSSSDSGPMSLAQNASINDYIDNLVGMSA